jgi:pyruvate-ferredoxin/flavodoxin oxidoreductase
MQKFKEITGREYGLVEYFGSKNAEDIIVIMGSGAETAIETAEYLAQHNEKVGVIKIHLFRPFPKKQFLKALPASCKTIAILDRTKEPGSAGEPLYEEVATTLLQSYCQKQFCTSGIQIANGVSGAAQIDPSSLNLGKARSQRAPGVYGVIHEEREQEQQRSINSKCDGYMPKVIAGRYGIASKEFTPAMVKAIFDELKKEKSKTNFTIGINDDVTHTSLSYDPTFDIEPDSTIRAIFYGLGSDGTVGANKNTVKIIGEETPLNVQAYFVYDSKKSGSKTVSHLRFGPTKIRSTYLIGSANFIGCHQFNFVKKLMF